MVRAAPSHTGANVVIWHGGRLLVVRHSYRAGFALPGGRLRCQDLSAPLDSYLEHIRWTPG